VGFHLVSEGEAIVGFEDIGELLERFVEFVGEPPMTYLSRWRLQLAARLLETSRKTVQEIASDVGYESEPAFNRAFKREFGDPPARYRRQRERVRSTLTDARS